jgi:hypothetical protein
MSWAGPDQFRDVLRFSQFRLKLIEFLKLPLNISEPALREALERTSPNVHRNYLARAKRAEETLANSLQPPFR